MRHVATVEGSMSNKRIMLVENSQDHRYQGGIICFIFLDNIDGPAEAGEFYHGLTVEQVKAELEDNFGIQPMAWREIPDQLQGCQDDWISPVRIAKDDRGEQIVGEWELLVDQRWMRITPATNRD
jgi:hypothetical protein